MAKEIKVGKVSKQQIITMHKAISREIEIEQGGYLTGSKVFKNKKAYSRKSKHRGVLC